MEKLQEKSEFSHSQIITFLLQTCEGWLTQNYPKTVETYLIIGLEQKPAASCTVPEKMKQPSDAEQEYGRLQRL